MHDARVFREQLDVLRDAMRRRQKLNELGPVLDRGVQLELERRTVTVRGRADNPLTTAEVEAKADELMSPVLGKSRTRELMDAIQKLETIASMRDLRPLLRA